MIAVAISFYAKSLSFLLFLALPWGVLVAMLSFSLIHMFSGDAIFYGLLVGCFLNLIVFLKLFLFRAEVSDHD